MSASSRLRRPHGRPTAQAPGGTDRGFTLVEAMITLAVLAILAAIAIPGYSEYLQRARLVEASVGLADLRTRLEQYFLDARTYPTACVPAAPGPPPPGQIYLPAGEKYFRIECALAATSYTITATGSAAGAMSGFVYAIDEAGRRATVALPAGWRGAGSLCWVTRKSGEC